MTACAWVGKHYADLPSLPVAKGPVMVHHVPRFLSMRRSPGEAKIALLVFDGLAIDQWVQIREHAIQQAPKLGFEEGTCFAWLPTLTSVSRQALFSGLKPREFADTIESTAASRRSGRASGKTRDCAPMRSCTARAFAIPVSSQRWASTCRAPRSGLRASWWIPSTRSCTAPCWVNAASPARSRVGVKPASSTKLFSLLLDKGFHVYLTADHGNCEAVGTGRPNQGVIAETRGERVRVYRSELLRADSAQQFPGTTCLDFPALPPDFLPLFAAGRTAFAVQGEALVAHGGISVEELIVPFVKVSSSP